MVKTSNNFTTKLRFFGKNLEKIPTFRVLNPNGTLINAHHDTTADKDTLVAAYKTMVKLRVLDKLMYSAQRQGKVSFYMTSTGEEAAQIGSAMALGPHDQLFAQYRETGALLWRGLSLTDMMNQMFGNSLGHGLGRQMPVHYGSKRLNIHTISSPLATQLPHAVGVAYAQKLSKSKGLTICYFGDGAASEGDAHAAFNFAACLKAPVLFFCRNNGYAISTPSHEQYKGDGIAARASGYNINAIRVDGNDLLAVYEATQEAKKYILQTNEPVIIEAMTYRVGHHSTSDDSSAYRSKEEVELWQTQHCPVARFRNFLVSKDHWPEDLKEDELLEEEYYQLVRTEFTKASKIQKPSVTSFFDDVYDKPPSILMHQKAELLRHLDANKEKYDLSEYKQN